MNAKRWLMALAAAGMVTSGTLVAAAQATEDPMPPAVEIMPGRFGQPGERGPRGNMREAGQRLRDAVRGGAGFGQGGYGLGALIRAAVDTTGLEAAEIAEQLRNDNTLASIVEAAGVNASDIVATVMAQAQEQAAQAVENGRITQETADELLGRLEAHLNELMIESPLSRRVEAVAPVAVLRFAAEEMGLDPRTVREALADGQTLASLLSENGIDVNVFIQDVLERAAARLNVAVVDGRISQERADQQLADLEAQLIERINGTGQAGV